MIDFIVILACILIVGGVMGNYIYKRVKHLPTGECSCCASKSKKRKNKLLKEYHKAKNECPCCKQENK